MDLKELKKIINDLLGGKEVFDLIPKDRPLKILDIGTGFGMWGYFLKVLLDNDPEIYGVEINQDRIKRLDRIMGVYKKLYEGDIRNESLRDCVLRNKLIDVVLMCHVIEHLSKEDSLKLLSELRHMSHKIIVLCPDGGIEYKADWIGGAHLSVWKKRDFEKIGMNVKRIPYSYRAGKVVSIFERIYFSLKGIKQNGVLVAWYARA